MALRASRILFVCYVALGGVTLTTACAFGGCNEAGCESALTARFPLTLVGAPRGEVHARICLDGTCRAARGVLDPHEGRQGQTRGNHFYVGGLEVTAVESTVNVNLVLPNDPYDDVETHQVVAELSVGDRPPVTLDEEFVFDRWDPNGPSCSPTCWVAEVTAAAR